MKTIKSSAAKFFISTTRKSRGRRCRACGSNKELFIIGHLPFLIWSLGQRLLCQKPDRKGGQHTSVIASCEVDLACVRTFAYPLIAHNQMKNDKCPMTHDK